MASGLCGSVERSQGRRQPPGELPHVRGGTCSRADWRAPRSSGSSYEPARRRPPVRELPSRCAHHSPPPLARTQARAARLSHRALLHAPSRHWHHMRLVAAVRAGATDGSSSPVVAVPSTREAGRHGREAAAAAAGGGGLRHGRCAAVAGGRDSRVFRGAPSSGRSAARDHRGSRPRRSRRRPRARRPRARATTTTTRRCSGHRPLATAFAASSLATTTTTTTIAVLARRDGCVRGEIDRSEHELVLGLTTFLRPPTARPRRAARAARRSRPRPRPRPRRARRA